jgi:hypothetical protein
MLHLSSERLAELADSEPTIAEAEHLAACVGCATERSAHQRLLTLAGDERDRLAPPLTTWASLSARLREEQIISTTAHSADVRDTSIVPLASRVAPRRHRGALLMGFRVAAGLVFALGFGALGRMSANAPAVPSRVEITQMAHQLVRDKTNEVLPDVFGAGASQFENVDEALAALESAQRQYDQAVSFIAAHDSTAQTPGAGDVFRTRLAALDEMAETSRLALAAAPTDPVLNQYYISTLGAREVTLRQLGSVLTEGKRLSRF